MKSARQPNLRQWSIGLHRFSTTSSVSMELSLPALIRPKGVLNGIERIEKTAVHHVRRVCSASDRWYRRRVQDHHRRGCGGLSVDYRRRLRSKDNGHERRRSTERWRHGEKQPRRRLYEG